MLRLRMDVPLFPQGKKKAFTLSYDDGVTQDKKFIELLDKYKLKGTFNLNSGTLGDKDWLIQKELDVSHYKINKNEVKELYKNHEVAVHTLTHLSLPHVPMNTVAYEIMEDRKNLEEICHKPIRGMAYPFGTYSKEVVETLRMLDLEYARTVKDTKGFDLPEDFLEWHPTCHHTEPALFEVLDKFLEYQSDEDYKSPQLFYLWGHTYEFEGKNQWNMIEEFFEKIYNKKEIWYASNIEVAEYIKSFQQLKYSLTGDYIYNPGRIDLWMCIDGRTYKLPSGEVITVAKP